ncbi:MAG TPA: VOC family protein [Kofleriaceae bacterium]|jgi:catechol 2,3-dioxygenase-like lactoylglutathione lyase family enzyme|nr:VOC family protein [Kofleriaceae bacterium]
MQINGIAHIQLTVTSFDACVQFYSRLMELFEMSLQYDEDDAKYWVGGRTGILISRCAEPYQHERFVQGRVGLHHLCFRARSREDVDRVYAVVQELGAKIVYPAREGSWAPGYYSVLFEDPDGIRIEVNHIPGKGNLDPSIQLPIRRPPT